MKYPVMSEAALEIHRKQWANITEWPKYDPCESCPLLSKCKDAPEKPGIEPYIRWLTELNMEAERINRIPLQMVDTKDAS